MLILFIINFSVIQDVRRKSCSRRCHPRPGPPQSQLRVTLDTQFVLKVARYSFSRSIPPKFERKLRRHKHRFGKIDTTVVLDKDETLLWSGLQWHRSCHGNEMTPLPILLAPGLLREKYTLPRVYFLLDHKVGENSSRKVEESWKEVPCEQRPLRSS